MKIDITDKAVKALKSPASGSIIHYDRVLRGFGVRITSHRAIAFVLNYSIHGRERRYTLGRWPERSALWARNEAMRLRGQVADGVDPQEEKLKAEHEQRTAPTVVDLARDYMERHAIPHKRPGSVRHDREILANNILPRLGEMRVSAVTRRDIELLHQSLKATPYLGNRVRALASKMFSLAVEWKWRSDNPAKGIQRFHEDKRETWLTVEQLENLKLALDSCPNQDHADVIRLLLVTGSRLSEVLTATWEDFDLQRGVWTKPSHHTKQKRTEHVPLSQAALDLLRRRGAGTGLLFPARSGARRVSLQAPWNEIKKAAGLEGVRLHDLRHTFASHLVSGGISLHIVGKLLGHTRSETTARYAHLADSTLREATNHFAQIYEMKPGAAGGGPARVKER